jgi:hypothetical protein
MTRKGKFVLIALGILGLTGIALADGCSFVKCPTDGQMMMQEECYWNNLHRSCKFGHDYYGPSGKEHHYVMVACD